jgi:recombination protein RecA
MARSITFEGMTVGNVERKHLYFASSLPSVNRAIGDMRGIQGGSIVQLLAEPGHGKTTMALDFIAQAQQAGSLKMIELKIPGKGSVQINAVFVDLERTFDQDYAKRLGVDVDKLAVYKPDFAEKALPALEQLLEEGLQLVVFDSVPAMITKDEFDKDVDEPARMAGSANILSRWLIRLLGLVDNSDTLFIFINQYRANLSPMARSDKKPFGPRALRYFSKIILELVKIKNEDDRSTIQLTVSKNKQSAEGMKIEYYMLKGRGMSSAHDILSLAIHYGVVRKGGAWYEYEGKKAQGMDSAISLFAMSDIKKKVEEELQNELLTQKQTD